MGLTILLADDHPIVRQGLRYLLEREAAFRIVGEAADGAEAVRLSERLKPDVLILDLEMPRLNGLDALPTVRRRSPGTRVVALSNQADEGRIAAAFRAGASAFVYKGCEVERVVEAVRRAGARQRFVCPPVNERLVDAAVSQGHGECGDPHDCLTFREREVLQLVAEGSTNAEIGARLHISQRTVEMHRSNLMRKLSLPNSAALVRYALDRGILSCET